MASKDNENWSTAAKGEFSNVINNPIEQTVLFDETKARYIKLKAVKVNGEDPQASFGEVGVITSN